MKECYDLINSLNILEDEYIVLACSYGPDSMALFDILKKLNLNIVIAHVNHNLRKESENEYIDLKTYCTKNNIIFEGMKINEYPNKVNIEDYARCERYNFFDKLMKKYNAKYLFTAHHGDDLVETILMRLTRGASFKGYAGFNKVTKKNNYYIVRPLIYLTKEEVINYDNENNIPYAIDQTNLENIHTRNIYRNNILPELKKINLKVHNKFIKFSDTINEYDDYIEGETDKIFNNVYVNNHLDLKEFELIPNLIKKRVLYRIMILIYQDKINLINDKHINMILDIINNQGGSNILYLPNKIIAYKYYNILEFSKIKEGTNNIEEIFNNELILKNGYLKQISNTNIIKSNYLLRLNTNDILLPFKVRNIKVGDKINLKNGLKKVSKVLIDDKVPKKDRNEIIVFTDSNDNILWIPGVKKSKFDKQINEDYDIIIKYVKKGEEDEK